MAVQDVGLVAVFVCLAPLACADGGECDEPLKICDIGSAGCREHVFVQTACARDFDGREVPVVNTITRDEFEETLRDDDEPTTDEAREDAQLATGLRMLALLQPGETSSSDAAIATYARNVLAFYSREDKSVTLIETNLGDADRDQQVFVLSHEFVHAQQDVDVVLSDFFSAYVTSTDSDMALRSVTEGEAVLFSNLTMARQPLASLDEDAVRRFSDEQQDALREAAGDPSGADFTDLRSSFPYPFGGDLLADRWFADGRSGVLGFYDDPPPSTAAILRTLDGETASEVDIPSLAADELPEGWGVLVEDTFGAWLTFAIARRGGISESSAIELAHDWLGDHVVIGGGPTDAEVALAWRFRFGSEASAQAFARIDDVPPPEGVRSITVDGRDVTLVQAVDAQALAGWEDAIERAVVEPGPVLRSEPVGRGMPRTNRVDPRRFRFPE